jgi:hypothetical protein
VKAAGWWLAGALAGVAWAVPAAANDSVAGLALGGLQLLRTHEIALVEEDLYISPDEVRVRYVFRNLTKREIDTLVAFPLPPVGFGFEFDWLALPHPDQANFVGFTTRTDGVEVPLEVQTRALVMGIDVTARLAELGVDPIPYADDILDRIAALPPPVRAALRNDSLIDAEGAPLWKLETVLWRRQVFPVGRDLVVEHRYVPVRSFSSYSPVGNTDAAIAPDDFMSDYADAARRQFCIEPEMEGELNFRRLDGAAPGERQYSTSQVDYVLSTGAHWAGPVRRFRLVVEVPNAWDAAFVCFEGARRVAPNRIEADLTDFWPEHDLSVLFLHLYGAGIEREF